MIPPPAIAGRRCTCVLFFALMLWLTSSWTEAAAPAIEWSASAYAAAENAGTVELRVIRSGDLAGISVVAFASTNGTAASGVDYTGIAGTLTFLPGDSNHVVNLTLLDNAVGQPSRFFNLRLSSLSNAVPGLQTNATVTVLDDETATALDPWFDAGAGAGDDIFALALLPDSRIVVGGQFTGFGGVPGLNYLTVLQPDGAVDASFSNAAISRPVYAVSPAADGSLYVGGDFNLVGGQLRQYFAKLKPGGGLDTNFPAVSVNNGLRAIFVQPDGKILIAGRFTQVGGQTRNRIARLNGDGSLDTGFTGNGADGNIRALALQPDGKILVAGQFTVLDGYYRNNIGRLNTNGTMDPTFNPGLGADRQVRSVAVQADAKVLLSGDFEQFDGYVHSCVVRLQSNGQRDGGFDAGPSPGDQIRVVAPAPGGKVWIGGSFSFAGGADRYYLALLGPDGLADPFRADPGFEVNTLLVQPDGQTLVAGDFGSIVGLPAGRIARLNTGGLPTPAPQIQLTTSNLFINEPAGQTAVTVSRRGDYTVSAQVEFLTRNGSAIAGADYTANAGTMTFAPQETAKILGLIILNDSLPETNETFFVALTNPAAPAVLVGATNASITIVSDDVGFEFTADTYATSEPVGSVVVTVRRSGSGSAPVSVDFLVASETALAGLDFIATNGTLIFQPGETQKVFAVTILADALTEGIEIARVLLTNASLGAALGARTNAALAIHDVDSTIQWSYAELPNESSAAMYAVIRRSGNLSLTGAVDWATEDGTATAGLDYVSASGTAIFLPGQIYAYPTVTLLNDGLVEGNETLYFRLSNPSPGAALVPNTNAVATIVDNDAGMSFVETNLVVSENSPFAVLPVRRHDDGNESFSVNYFTSDGSGASGVNYLSRSGTLVFPASSHTNYLLIPLLDVCGLANERTFTVVLTNPANGGALGVASTAVVTIRGNDLPGQRDVSLAGLGEVPPPIWYLPVPITPRVLSVSRSGQILAAWPRVFQQGDDCGVFDASGGRHSQFSPEIAGRNIYVFESLRDGRLLAGGSYYGASKIEPWLNVLLPSGQVDPTFITPGSF